MLGSTSANVGAIIIFIVLIVLAICIYFMPTIIGAQRKVVNVGSVFAINLLLGWTLIGWAVALAMALRTNPPYAYPQQQYPVTATTPHVQGPPAGWYADPEGTRQLRWWDGRTWTEHYTPQQSL